MAIFELNPTRENLHGHFSRDLTPILTIDSGDTVVFRTLEAGWGLAPNRKSWWLDDNPHIEPRDPVLDAGHCLVGPVFVRGAEPGKTLVVHIEEIVPGDWGWTAAGGWPHEVNDFFGITKPYGTLLQWDIDPANLTATNQHGHTVALRPFMGVVGMPINKAGVLPTSPPYPTGGNLDCKALVAGTTLYLPIEVEGGLFSTGDGHARQGDGEVSVMAIECPMERVRLRFEVLDKKIPTPRAETNEGLLTFGLHEDLNRATLLSP